MSRKKPLTTDLNAYFALTQTHPEWFVNPEPPEIVIALDPGEIAAIEAEVATANPDMAPAWLKAGVVFEDRYLLILRDAVRFPGGKGGLYNRFVEKPIGYDGIVTLPVYQGKIILIKVFRHSLRRYAWEVCRGFGEHGLTPEQNAAKELREEISATVERCVFMQQFYFNTGLSFAAPNLVFAEVSSIGALQAEESIRELKLVTPAEFDAMVAAGEMQCGPTIAAYTAARARGLV